MLGVGECREGAGVVTEDELAEALDLRAVTREDRHIVSVGRFPVQVDEGEWPRAVGESEAEVVLHKLVGIEQPEGLYFG
jgi:hypothetical protein